MPGLFQKIQGAFGNKGGLLGGALRGAFGRLGAQQDPQQAAAAAAAAAGAQQPLNPGVPPPPVTNGTGGGNPTFNPNQDARAQNVMKGTPTGIFQQPQPPLSQQPPTQVVPTESQEQLDKLTKT